MQELVEIKSWLLPIFLVWSFSIMFLILHCLILKPTDFSTIWFTKQPHIKCLLLSNNFMVKCGCFFFLNTESCSITEISKKFVRLQRFLRFHHFDCIAAPMHILCYFRNSFCTTQVNGLIFFVVPFAILLEY